MHGSSIEHVWCPFSSPMPKRKKHPRRRRFCSSSSDWHMHEQHLSPMPHCYCGCMGCLHASGATRITTQLSPQIPYACMWCRGAHGMCMGQSVCQRGAVSSGYLSMQALTGLNCSVGVSTSCSPTSSPPPSWPAPASRPPPSASAILLLDQAL